MKRMQRPTDPYSTDWNEYWRQNPHLNRSVGAGGEGDVDPPVDPPTDPPAIDPAEFQRIQKEYADTAKRLKLLEDNNKALLEEKRQAKEAADKAVREAAKKAGDVEALEKSWSEKMNSALAERDGNIEQYKGMVRDLTIGATATRLAADIFGEHAELMQHHIVGRLVYEIADGKPVVRVLDREGKASAANIEDLKKEISADKRFAPFVVGSKASGPGGHGKSGTPGLKEMSRSEFDKLDPASKYDFINKKGGKVTD